MDFIADLVKDFLLAVLWWILLFPVILLAVTPFILLISLFGNPMFYMGRVGEKYRSVICFWSEWGIFIVP